MSTSAIEVAHRHLSLDSAFERLPTPALIVDRRSLDLLHANRAAAALLGDPRQADATVVGRPLAGFVVEPSTPLHELLSTAATRGPVDVELESLDGRRNGATIGVAAASVPEVDGPVPWVVSLQPIRKASSGFASLNQKVLEDNQRALNRQREKLSAANAELRAAQDRLIRMNSDLDHFAHIAAHDLREPCRRQIGLIDALQEDLGPDLTDDVRWQLTALARHSVAMLDMVDGFRALADLAGPEVELSTVDLGALVGRILDDHADGLADAEVRCSLPAAVTGYEPLLAILYRQLVDNAIRHGARPLRIEIGSDVEDDRTVYTVTNTAEPDRVLGNDPLRAFVRGSGDNAGTGLGLSACVRVVQRHGGHISVEPTDGTFAVRFTLERRES